MHASAMESCGIITTVTIITATDASTASITTATDATNATITAAAYPTTSATTAVATFNSCKSCCYFQ